MGNEHESRGNSSDYADTGCEFSPRCGDCTLEECAEMPGGKQLVRLKFRAAAMKKMRHSGIGVREVAQAFGVCVRTVQREMKMRRGIRK